jgi:hypothetical protein
MNRGGRVSLVLFLVLLGSSVFAHGFFEKAFSNRKTNGTVRGLAKGGATELFMMQPKGYLNGKFSAVGFRLTAQDEEAATQENVTLSYVPYGQDGIHPDPNKEVLKSSFRLFGFGDKGQKAYNFLLTVGFPQTIPQNFGIKISLPKAPKWPLDGASIHGQLNLPNDSQRPRVPTPFQKEVFAFERPGGQTKLFPLGGRALDVLETTGVFIEPVLQTVLISPAYGLGEETLKGIETLHPSAARKDKIFFEIQGGQIGASGFGIVFLSSHLLKTPIPGPVGDWYLSLTPPFPFLLEATTLDPFGKGKTKTYPFSLFPKRFRDFWVQCIILNPATKEMEFTDSVRIQGL